MAAQHFIDGIAQHLGKAGIDFNDATRLVEDGNALYGIFNQRPVPCGFVFERRARRFVLGNIAPYRHQTIPTAQLDGADVDMDIK